MFCVNLTKNGNVSGSLGISEKCLRNLRNVNLHVGILETSF